MKAPPIPQRDFARLRKLGEEVRKRETERVRVEEAAKRKREALLEGRTVYVDVEAGGLGGGYDALHEIMRRADARGVTVTGRAMTETRPDLHQIPNMTAEEAVAAMRRALRVDNIAREDFPDGAYVSYISTPHPLDWMRPEPRLRYEVGIFRPDADTEIRQFSTHQEGMDFYRRAVAIERSRCTATAAASAQVAAIQQRQKKLQDRMIGRLVFTKRKIRVRRDK